MAPEWWKKTRMGMDLTRSHTTAVARMPASSGLAKGEVGFGGSLVPRQVDVTVSLGRPRSVLCRFGTGPHCVTPVRDRPARGQRLPLRILLYPSSGTCARGIFDYLLALPEYGAIRVMTDARPPMSLGAP